MLGVDPDGRMADLARRSGVEVEVEVATIETWDPAGRHFDTVIAGQAWHWVDPVAGAVKAAQALRPGGRLAVFWNSSLPPPELNEAMGAVFRRIAPDTRVHRGLPGPDGYSALCAKAAAGMRQAGAFGEPEQWRIDGGSYSRDEWLDQVPTFGGIGQLPRSRGRHCWRTSAPPSTRSGAASRWGTPRWRPARHGSDARQHPVW